MTRLPQARTVLAVSTTAMLVAIAFFGGIGLAKPGESNSQAQPADKIAVAGSGVQPMNIVNDVAMIFNADIKTSSPTDLIIDVRLECALWTYVEAFDNPLLGPQDTEAEARVVVWVEVDGIVVPVASDDVGTPGEVVFCDRVHGIGLEELDEEDPEDDEDNATVRNYLRTRTANAFNWVDLNVGHGVHTIQVFAKFETDVSHPDHAQAEAAVGKRTLVVDPVKLANNAEI